MARTTCEIMWVNSLLKEFSITETRHMAMQCANKVAIFIASNRIFHEHTKHVEVDCHFGREVIMFGHISTPLQRLKTKLLTYLLYHF